MDEKRIYGLTFNEVEVPPSRGCISFGYWSIDPNKYDHEKEKQNFLRDRNNPHIEFLDLETLRGQRLGETFITKLGSYAECVEYIDAINIYFEITTELYNGDVVKYLKRSRYSDRNIMKSPFDRSIYKIAYSGVGPYSKKSFEIFYAVFHRMIERCHSIKNKIDNPTYVDCDVHPIWHNSQTFIKWCEENYYEIPGEDMELDKDLLVKGNTIYHPDFCTFLPADINTLFRRYKKQSDLPIGVSREGRGYIARLRAVRIGTVYPTPEEAFYAYKEAKEKEIKRIADVYMYEKGGQYIQQFQKVYQAMYNYQVEITD